MPDLLTINPYDSGAVPTVDGETCVFVRHRHQTVALIQTIEEETGEVNICIDTHPDAKFSKGGLFKSLNRQRWFLRVKEAEDDDDNEIIEEVPRYFTGKRETDPRDPRT